MKRVLCWLAVFCLVTAMVPAVSETYEEGYYDELYLDDEEQGDPEGAEPDGQDAGDAEELSAGEDELTAGEEEDEAPADEDETPADEDEETADAEEESAETGEEEETSVAAEETPAGTEETETLPKDSAEEDDSRILTLSLIGDCAIGDEWEHFGRKTYGSKSGIVKRIQQEGMDYPFRLVADLFAKDDLTVANCECTISDLRKAKKQAMALIAPSEYAEVFKLGNVDVCNLANNHSQDFFKAGRKDTAVNLKAQGIGVFYDDAPYSVTVKGVKIGFVGYCYPMDATKLKKYVKYMDQLRDEGCTFVIASAHWGKEEKYSLDGNQKYAVKLIDAGFDMVYGHGSHTCQMIRWYKGKPIFYGLSNFTFGANAAPKDDDTVVAQIRFDIHEDGTVTARDLTCIPFKMHKNKNFQPYPIPETDTEGRQRVWEKLYYNSQETNYKKHKASPAPSLPESFLTTGYVDFTTLPVTEE